MKSTLSNNDSSVIHRFFKAMQAGQAAKEDMMELFADNAHYIEPFSGSPRTHIGRAQILACMEEGWKFPLPDMRIEINRIDVQAHVAQVDWTCYSVALPGGSGMGTNYFTIVDGRIDRLETRLRF